MTKNGVNELLESVVSVVSSSEKPGQPRGWGKYPTRGPRSRGRYGVCESSARCLLLDSQAPDRLTPYIDETRPDMDMGTELNLQFCQLTLKSNHLQALGQPVSSDQDVLAVFGPRSLQVAVVEEAEHRTWYRLIGREHDVQAWDPDSRTDVQELDRFYDPGEPAMSEQWIVELFVRFAYRHPPPFLVLCCPVVRPDILTDLLSAVCALTIVSRRQEPIRLANYVPPKTPDIPFMLPERVFTDDDDIAYMCGLHPEEGGNLIEVVLIKSLRCVMIYMVSDFLHPGPQSTGAPPFRQRH